MATFDLYKDGKVDQEGVASPITITGLKPETTYSGYSIAYAGKPDKTIIADFKTQPAPVVKMASFKIDNATLSGETGKTGTVKVSDVLPANTTNKLIKATSLDEKIATVKDNGDASYTVTYVAEGTTTINFASADGGAHQSVAVTVKKPVVKMTSFKIDNLESAGKVGENVKLTLSDITPADTTNKGVDIWVDDTEVATVASNDGNTFTVNLVKKGTTGIHWLAKDGGGAKADGTVTVSAKPAPEG